MVVLKKIKASTLVESLVASVIIVVVFTIASLTLNNVFGNAIRSNTSRVEHRMHTIHYLFISEKITMPYKESFENWTIHLHKTKELGNDLITIEASQGGSKKKIIKEIAFVESN